MGNLDSSFNFIGIIILLVVCCVCSVKLNSTRRLHKQYISKQPFIWHIYIYIYIHIHICVCVCVWFVPKVSVLILYLNVYWTHLKLQVTTFKIWPLGRYKVVPVFPLIIVLEVIFRKCVYLIGYNFLYVFHRPEMTTFQFRFQLREEVEITRS